MDALLQDLRYAVRTLRKSPGFTVVAVLTLALGTTATLTMFAVVEAVLIRPLPFPQANRLIGVHEQHPQRGWMAITPANFRDIQQQTTAFEALGAVESDEANLRIGTGAARTVAVGRLGTDIFPALGLGPIAGREFVLADFAPDATPVAIVSAALWREALGSAPTAVGTTVHIGGDPYVVIGVAPPALAVLGDIAVWTPVQHPAVVWPERQYHVFLGIGRLRGGVPLSQARAQLDVLAERLSREHPATNTNWTFAVTPLDTMILGTRVRPILLILMAAAIGVLLIGCINVANLFMTRAKRRQREIAVRLALGCGRARLIQQLLAEGALMSAGGVIAGVALAGVAMPTLERLPLATDLAFRPVFALDATFACGVLAIFAGTTMLAALAPAWNASGGDPRGALASRTTTAARSGMRRLLTGGELAVAVLLLASALVLLRSADRLAQIDPGLKPERVATAAITIDDSSYPTDALRDAYFARILDRVQSVPGVSTAALTNYAPLTAPGFNLRLTIEGRPAAESGDVTTAPLATVSPQFFATLQIPLRRGRLFEEHDAPSAPLVLLINSAFAHNFFGASDPIGRRIRLGAANDAWRTVVGVVGDVSSSRLEQGPEPTVYAPLAQEPRATTLLVRTEGALRDVAPAIRQALIAVDSAQAISELRPFEEIVAKTKGPSGFRASVLTAFGLIAWLLTTVGVYGVVAFTISQRTTEWGIRLAVGADPSSLVLNILAHELVTVVAGEVAGIIAAWALMRLARSFVFGVSTFDPLSVAVAALAVLAAATIACYLPARRAARVDPMIALRAE